MINSKELCEKLGIHKNTLYHYLKLGLPSVKLERKYLFNYEEVIKWLNNK